MSNEALKQAIDGLILSDMSVEQTSTISARLCMASKHRVFAEHVANLVAQMNYICNDIAYLSTSKKSCIKSRPKYFKVRSRSYPDFLTLRQLWYPDGDKIIPSDLGIHPITLLYMYLGDGCLGCNRNYKTKSAVVTFYTNGFDDKSLMCLKVAMEKYLGFELRVRYNGFGNKILVVLTRHIEKFFSKLPSCPADLSDIFGYKWRDVNQFPRKRDWENALRICV